MRDLEAALGRRRLLTFELALHVLGDLLHYTLKLVVQYLGPRAFIAEIKLQTLERPFGACFWETTSDLNHTTVGKMGIGEFMLL